MIEPGKKYTMTVVKETSFGLYLARTPEAGENERILLPAKQVPSGTRRGDTLEVFVYRDSQDRLICTVHEPRLTLGQVALLQVKQVTRIGAFLDWGLEKDLLLPFHEQTCKVKEGDDVLAALYLDKSGRLCATMKLYHFLSSDSPYHAGDTVTARVYEISGNFGVFLAVDDRFSAMIPRQEAQGGYQVGALLTVHIVQVREDGKLTVTCRKKAYLQMEDDARQILDILEHQGSLPLGDKSTPEEIRDVLGLSKNAFKRAAGRLLKEGLIELDDHMLRKKQ